MASATELGSYTMLGYLAESVGATEPALRLLLSILLGYPFAFLHRLFLLGGSPVLQHCYFISCGLLLGYFNYGFDMIHSVACILIMYAILVSIGGTFISVVLSFTFYMGYLIYSYLSTGTDDYDIKWSMPQCVLTLRLIGLAYDVYDGQKDQEKLPADQKKTALTSRPNLLEIAGHTYFFGGFMVGPQFPMKRYVDFIEGRLKYQRTDGKPSCVKPAMIRLALGVIVLSTYQIGSIFVPEKSVLSEEFTLSYPLWKKLLIIGFWGKCILHKYIACWLFAEGSCMLTGMTYNGQDANGKERWDGCANVDFAEFSKVTTFGSIIKTFNINTNLWVAQYVFKRLKFLGNRFISQAAALSFLALWHGLHSGYYICFFNEFIVMWTEKDFETFLNRVPKVKCILTSNALKIPMFIIMKIHVDIFMGYCLLPFVLLSWDRYNKVYGSVYYLGHVIYLGWPIVAPVLKLLVPKQKESAKTQ